MEEEQPKQLEEEMVTSTGIRVGADMPALEPSPMLQLPTDINPDRVPLEVGEAPTLKITETGKHRERLDRLSPRRQMTGIQTQEKPEFWRSTAWNIAEDGVTANISRWLTQTIEGSMIEDKRPEEDLINKALPELMDGIDPQYEAHIAMQPSLAMAEREANLVRQSQYRQALQQNEGGLQALGAGMLGFVLDPINLVPGGVLMKGTQLATKGTLSMLARQGMSKTALGVKAASWAAAGGVEELARGRARLEADPTFTYEKYLDAAKMSAAFGGALPILGAAGKNVSPALRGALNDINDFAASYGMDVSTRALLSTAKDTPAMLKAKDLDFSTKFKEMKVKARNDIDAKFTEFRKSKATKDIDDALNSKEFEDGNYDALVDKLVSGVDEIAESVKKRMPDAPKAVEEVNTLLEKARKDMEKAFGLDKKEAAKAFGEDSAGAARVQRTAEEARAEAVEVAKMSIAESIQKAQSGIESFKKSAYEIAAKYSDMAEVKDAAAGAAKGVKAEAAGNLKHIIDGIADHANNALEVWARSKGRRPTRMRLGNKEAGEHLVYEQLKPMWQMAHRRYTALQTQIINQHGVKDLAAGTVVGGPELDSIARIAQAAVKKSFAQGGINAKVGIDPFQQANQAWSKLSHVQRAYRINRMSDAWQRNAQKMTAHIVDRSNLKGQAKDDLIAALKDIEDVITMELDLAHTMAKNPYVDAVAVKAKYFQISESFQASVNTREIYEQFANSKTQSLAKHQLGRITESLSSRLLKSEVPLAQWFTMNVLETPAGFGGKLDRNTTGAILAQNWDNQHRYPVLKGWEDMMQEIAKEEGWSYLKRLSNKQGNAKTHKDVEKISNEVMMEINNRNLGKPSTARPAVKKYVDTMSESYDKLHDLQNGRVAGINASNKIKDYHHQVWDDGKIIELANSPEGREMLHDLFRKGYEGAGMDRVKAYELARAMIDQKMAVAAQPGGSKFNIGEEALDGVMPDLVGLVNRLKKNGNTEETVREIIEHLNDTIGGNIPGYAQTRAKIDYSASMNTADGPVTILDLMNKDVPGVFSRYSKEATARAAISESTNGMLKSDRDMEDFLSAVGLQAQAMGGVVNTRQMRNALQIMMGRQYAGQLPMDVRRARDAISLAGMGGLGESQLAELGMALNRGMSTLTGIAATTRSRVGRHKEKYNMGMTDAQVRDRALMKDLQEVSGLFEDMHLVERRNIHFDAKEADTGMLSRVVDTATGGKYRPLLQYAQSKFTGYGAIRSWEDQIAMASLTQDIAKRFGEIAGKTVGSKRKPFSSDARFRDMGVDLNPDGWLAKNFKEYVEYSPDGTRVEALNLHAWSQVDRAKFGVIMNRYASQQIQKGFVGEMSPEMSNPWVAFLMQFRSYPILAAEKQVARTLKFADKEAAIGIGLNSITSAVSRIIRIHSLANSMPEEKREEYIESRMKDLAADTWTYMGPASMTPALFDLGNGLISGTTDRGKSMNIADQIPVLSFMNKYAEVYKSFRGDKPMEDRDYKNMQSALPLGTISFSNILFGTIREKLYETEAERMGEWKLEQKEKKALKKLAEAEK